MSDIRNTARYKRQRAEFFDAHGPVGVCHVCGDPVDMSLDGRTMWGKTVDHVVPLTAGGDPFDKSNWALAHNRCNKLKGIGPVGPVGPRAERSDLTPGDPRYCWRQRPDGVWSHYNPIHNIGDCEWPGCPHNEPVEP